MRRLKSNAEKSLFYSTDSDSYFGYFGLQSLNPVEFNNLMQELREIARAIGREI